MAIRWWQSLFSGRARKRSSRRLGTSRSRRLLELERLELRLAPTVYNWLPTAAGTYAWNSAANWGGAGFPNAAGDVANLDLDILGNQTINLNQAITVATLNLGDAIGSSTITIAEGSGGSLSLSGTTTIGKTGSGVDVITATITGAGSLTKSGPGTLTLNNSSNGYSGGTTISQGTLRLGSSLALPFGEDVTVNGTLDLGAGSPFIGALTGGGVVTNNAVGGRVLTLGLNDRSCTFSGIIQNGSGSVHLAKEDAGTLILTGANTYTGNTTLRGGTLQAGGAGALGPTGQIRFEGGTLQYSAANATDYSGRFNSSAIEPQHYRIDTNGRDVTFAAALTHAGGTLAKLGAGSLTLAGANTYGGGTEISGGVLQFNSDGAIGGSGRSVTVRSGGAAAFAYPFTNTTLHRITSGSAGVVALAADNGNSLDLSAAGANLAAVSLGATGAFTYSGTLTPHGSTYRLGGGGGSLTLSSGLGGARDLKVGGNGSAAGTVILAAANTYSGATTISGGVLQFNSDSAIGGSGRSVTVGSGGSAAFAYAFTNATLLRLASDSAGVVALAANNSNDLDLSATGANLAAFSLGATGAFIYSGTLTPHGSTYRLGGGGSLTVSSDLGGNRDVLVGGNGMVAGTVILEGANTYIGGTTVSGGTLQAGSAEALGSTGTIRFGGGTLQYSAANATDYSDRFSAAAGQPYRIDTNGRDVTFATALTSPGGSLTKLGAGTLTLTGTNTYTGGTTISGGTLELGSPAALPASGDVTVDGTLDLRGSNARLAALGAAGLVTSSVGDPVNLTVSLFTDTTFAGRIEGPIALTKSGPATLTLAGANTYTGGTTLGEGTLALGSAGALGASGTISLGGGTLRYSAANATDYSSRFSTALDQQYRIDTNGRDVTFATALSSPGGSLTKLGAGTLTLSGPNSYSGGTIISHGTLQLGALNALPANAVVAVDGTLDLGGISPTLGALGGAGLVTSSVVGPVNLTVSVAADTTFFGRIQDGSGNVGLTKSGPGTLILARSSMYSGGTILSGGTLQAARAGALGTLGTISFGGGTLQYAANATDYSSRFSALAGQLYRIDTNGQNVTFAAALTSPGGSLTKLGAGTLTLTGANTYSGGTTIGGGVLQFNSDGAVGGSGPSVTVSSGSTAAFGYAFTTTTLQRIAGGSAGVVALAANNGNPLDLSAAGLAAASLGATGAFSYSGALTPHGSTYRLGGGGGILTVSSGLGGANGLLVGGNGTAAGTVILTGTNTYSGATTISGGVLQFNSDGAIGGSGPSVTVSSGSTAAFGYAFTTMTLQRIAGGAAGVVALAANNGNALDLSAANLATASLGATGAFTYSGTLTPHGSTYRLGGGGGSLTVSSSLGGAHGLVGGGNGTAAGTVVLTGANTYTGGTTIGEGTLQAGSAGALGTSGTISFGGGTLRYAAANAIDYSARFSNAANQPYRIDTNGQNVILAAALTSPAGSLTKLGLGTLTLTGVNSYGGGTTISSGTLVPGNPGALGSGPVTLAGGTLSLSGTGGQGPVTVTGFNHDVIWGSSEGSAFAGTSAAFDGAHVFYQAGVSGAPAGTGLPVHGSFTSVVNPAVRFDLPPYTQNNVLRTQSPGGQTLTLQTPSRFQSLNLLAAAAGSAATFDFTLHFADGSQTTVADQTAPDWLFGSPYALAGVNRSDRSTSTFDTAHQGNNPRLYEIDHALSAADQLKTLTAITFDWVSGGDLGVFAVAGHQLGAFHIPNDLILAAPLGGTIATSGSTRFVLEGDISGSGALTTTGFGFLALNGVNTYSGGTILSQATLELGPSAGSPLGSGSVTTGGGLPELILRGQGGYAPVPVAGFNQDVVWAASETSASAGTSAAFDGGGHVFYEAGVSGAPAGTGLLSGRMFLSAADPAVPFQLAPYTQPNVLQTQSPGGRSLSLVSPGRFRSLSLLAAGAGGAATFDFTLRFADGSQTTVSNRTAPDWLGGSAYALAGVNRYHRTAAAFDDAHLANDPRLYALDYALSAADQEKTLTALTFHWVSGGVLGVFAVSGDSRETTYFNNISGSVDLSIPDPGTWTLAGDNTYSGFTDISQGTLRLGSPTALSGFSLTVNGTLDLHGFSASVGGLSGTGLVTSRVAGFVNLTVAIPLSLHDITFSGLIQDGSGTVALTTIGSSSGTQILAGANTYSGGTTLQDGTLAPVSPGALGSGAVTLAGGTLSLPAVGWAPVPVTGFNQDVVWAASETSALAGTSAAFDGAGGHVLYEAGVSGAPAGTGLPSSRVFTSAANPPDPFQLQPYTQNNALLTQSPGGQTLTLATPRRFHALSLLAAAADDDATFDVTLHFSGGSQTTVVAQTAPDWLGGSPYYASGFNRYDLATNTFDTAHLTNDPRLYQLDFALSAADQLKTLTALTFHWVSGGALGVFAVSGNESESTTRPVPVTGFNQDVIWASSEGSAATGTSAAFDGAGGHVFYQAGISGAPAGTGLPSGRTFQSVVNSQVPFQLQPYTQNNVLLTQNPGGQTLTLATPGRFHSLSLLAAGAGGDAAFNFTLHFADGSQTTVAGQTAPDWIDDAPSALGGFNRYDRASNTFDTAHLTNQPGLFEIDYALAAADQEKALTAITFHWVSGSALGVFAVSGHWLDVYLTNIIAASGGGIATAGHAAVVLAGNISGTGGFTKAGPGTLILTGTNTHSSTGISQGTLQLGSPDALPAGGGVNVETDPSFSAADSILDLRGFSASVEALSGRGVVTSSVAGAVSLTVGRNNFSPNFSGSIQDGNGSIALIKVGSNLQELDGVNTYSGGTTIIQGTLDVGPSAVASLGSGPVTLAGGTLTLQDRAWSPVAVTGFNQDVIWAQSEASASAGTSAAFDGAGGHVLYQLGVSGAPSGTGLPFSGTFVSAVNPEVSFALQPYTQDNVLLTQSPGGQTLTLQTPGRFESLNLLAAAAGGAAAFNFTLHFADGGQTTVAGQTAPDWLGDAPAARAGFNRYNRTAGAFDNAHLANDPRLYGIDHALSAADRLKTLTALTFHWLGGGALGVFAVSGHRSTSTPTPVPVSGFNHDVVWASSEGSAAAGTSADFNGAGHVFYEAGVSGAPSGTGLPSSGTFQSVVNPDVGFALQPYTQNNVLLTQSPGGQTLTLGTPERFESLSLLAAAAGAAATFNFTLHFADGSQTTVAGQTAPDWLGGAPYALAGVNRYDRTAGAFDNAHLTNDPRLYEVDYSLTAVDRAKPLTAITFHWVSGGALGVFAVSGNRPNHYTNDIVVSANSTVSAPSGVAVLAGVISGSGALTKAGFGILYFTGANTYTGGTTLSQGTLALGSAGALGPAGTISFNGGTLQYTAANSADNSSRFSSAANQQYRLDTNVQDVTIATALTSSGGSLTKLGSGTLTLSAANTYTGGTTVSAGTLRLGVANALPVTPVTVSGTLDLGGLGATVGTLSGSGVVTTGTAGDVTLTVGGSGSTTFSGSIQDGSGRIALTKTGTGTQTLTGANTYTGATTISQGTLSANSTNALPIGADVTVNGTLDLRGISRTVGALGGSGVVRSSIGGAISLTVGSNDHGGTFTGIIQNGAGSAVVALTKIGAGTLTLTGANTYSGTTTITAGTLEVGAGGSLISPIAISGGTLAGRGIVNNTVTVSGTGHMAPGAGGAPAGTLTTGNVTFAAGTALDVDLNGTTAGTSHDQLAVTGNVDFSAGPELNLALGYTPSADDFYTIVTATGSITGTFSGLADGATFSVGGLLFEIDYTASAVTLTRSQQQETTVTVTATGSQTYGGANQVFVVSYDGFVNGDDESVVSGTPIFSTTALANSPVSGTYTASVDVSGLSAPGYTFVAGPAGTFIVNRAPLTVTAAGAATYGDATTSLSYTASGFVLGETTAVLGGTPSFVTSYQQDHHAGSSETVSVSGLTADDYTIAFVEGSFTVAKAALTITASGSATYGDAAASLSYTASGFVLGETTAVLGGTPSFVTSYQQGHHAGSSETVSVSGLTADDYTIAFVEGNFTVAKAALTITAEGSATYGDAAANLAYTASGFVLGETAAVLGGTPSFVTSYQQGHHASSVETVSVSGQTSDDYAIAFVDGSFTVTSRALSIVAHSTSKTYGQTVAFTGSEFTSAGLLSGDTVAAVTLTSAGAAATAPVAGSPYAIIPSAATGTGLGNYAITYVDGSLTVLRATLTITADNRNKVTEAALPTFTATYTGLVNGEGTGVVSGLVLSTTAAASSPVGSYPITASGGSAANYIITPVNGTLTVVTTLLQGSDLLVGGSPGADTFTFTPGTTAGTVVAVRNGSTLGTFAATGTVTAHGGGGTDTVVVNGNNSVNAFTLDGGVVLNGQPYHGDAVEAWQVNALGAGDSIAVVSGSATVAGGNGTDTLALAAAGNALWTLTAPNAGTLSYAGGAVVFTKVERLTGGGAADTFVLQGTGSVGGITAGGGTDTLDYSAQAAAVTVNLQTGSATRAGTTSGLEVLIGSQAVDTLIGPSTANAWAVTGADAGSLNGAVSISGFENWTGGTAVDTFTLHGGSVSGAVNGGGGSDVLDLSQHTGPVTVDLAGPSATGVGQFSSIAVLRGTAGMDTVRGANAATNWELTGAGAVTVGPTAYDGFEELLGGTGADTFKVLASTVVFAVVDGGNGSDTVTGFNQVNDWVVMGADAATLNGQSFTDVQNLTGGTDDDRFRFLDGGSVSGAVKGQGGDDILDFSARSSAVEVNLETRTVAGVVGSFTATIEELLGSGASDRLIGPDTAGTVVWDITGASAGAVSNYTFGSFEVLQAGAGKHTLNYDTFTTDVSVNLPQGTATGFSLVSGFRNATGGAGNDLLIGDAANNVLSGGAGNDLLLGGAGNDTVQGGDGQDILVGGSGADTLDGGDGDDLLIADRLTFHDESSGTIDAAALDAIFQEWTRPDAGYLDRIAHLRGTQSGGLNGTTYLDASVLVDDGQVDTLFGRNELDWFLIGLGDLVKDEDRGETVTGV